MEVVGRERLKIMTGTCDTEGRISVIIERKMPQGDLATGENERNGAKEADATGSMVLHSLCARRRGLRHHRSCRCRRRVAQLSDLWQNGYEPLSSTSGFSFAPVSCVESLSLVVDEFYARLLLTSEYPVQRARDLFRRRV